MYDEHVEHSEPTQPEWPIVEDTNVDTREQDIIQAETIAHAVNQSLYPVDDASVDHYSYAGQQAERDSQRAHLANEVLALEDRIKGAPDDNSSKPNLEAWTSSIQKRRAGIEKENKEIQAGLADNYERLYALNPNTFAGLPTSQFMDLSREYSSLIRSVEEGNSAVDWIGSFAAAARGVANDGLSKLEEHRDDKKMTKMMEAVYSLAFKGSYPWAHTNIASVKDKGDAERFLRDDIFNSNFEAPEFIEDMGISENNKERVVELAKGYAENVMDRTPRQNAEAFAKLFEQMASDIEPTLSESRQKLNGFEDEHGAGRA
jgi:hypothetical protein